MIIGISMLRQTSYKVSLCIERTGHDGQTVGKRGVVEEGKLGNTEKI